MYACIYVYIHAFTHIQASVRARAHTQTHTSASAWVRLCVCVSVCVRARLPAYAFATGKSHPEMATPQKLGPKSATREGQVEALAKELEAAKRATAACLARRFGFDLDLAIQHLKDEGLLQVETHPTHDDLPSTVPRESERVDPATTLLGKLLLAIEKIPAETWQDAALTFQRPALQDRAVTFSFIQKFVVSLAAFMPEMYERLNSYMIIGSENLECRCHPDELDKCTHLQNGKVCFVYAQHA